ncbi:MAG: hypothetical protein ACK52S_18420 [Pirellula sp.]
MDVADAEWWISSAISEAEKLTQRNSIATDRGRRRDAWFWLAEVLVLSIVTLGTSAALRLLPERVSTSSRHLLTRVALIGFASEYGPSSRGATLSEP